MDIDDNRHNVLDYQRNMPRSPQEEYAANLGSSTLGLPVVVPFLLLEHSGRVGDIGFFDKGGNYHCLANAFDTLVLVIENLAHVLSGSRV
jgi:hypothetical protein